MRCFLFFFFNDTATTEIYTLSLHDALPISSVIGSPVRRRPSKMRRSRPSSTPSASASALRRSEEHTSELQSHLNLVCRLLLEKKKKKNIEQRKACYTYEAHNHNSKKWLASR